MQSTQGVTQAKLSYGAAKLQVWGEVEPEQIRRLADQAGYSATYPNERRGIPRPFWRRSPRLWLTILSGLALAFASFGAPAGLVLPPMQKPVLALAILLGGYYPYRSAFYALRRGRLEMNVLMSVATVGAVIIGEWFEGATVIFLFTLGETLEARSLDGARRSITDLMELAPDQAVVVRDGEEQTLPTSDVRPGDVCIVRPGYRIPVDGHVVDGESTVNEASVTGESVPVDKAPGDLLYAGSINERGVLRFEVDRPASESTLARIVNLVEEAQGRKAPSQSFVDRFAQVYTPAVMLLAVGVAAVPPLLLGELFRPWIYRGLALLVLSCPCALVISTPVAIVSALSNAARNGLLIKGGVHLETLASVNAVAFDKTGTLTKARLAVTDVISVSNYDQRDVLACAAGIEWGSEHPIASAIVCAAKESGAGMVEVNSFQAKTGLGAQAVIAGKVYSIGNVRFMESQGVGLAAVRSKVRPLEREGKTLVVVAVEKTPLGVIALADTVKEESRRAVQRLKKMGGIDSILMLTGDNEGASSALAAQIEIDEYKAGLLPGDKVKAVEAWQRQGKRVAMIGDGINDGPALAAADVGIAMGAAGSDTALETADVALMGDDLSKLPYAVALARRTMRIIRQNITFAIGIKVIALGFLVSGHLTLWLAIVSDMGASLLVTLNGMRLLRRIQVKSREAVTRLRP